MLHIIKENINIIINDFEKLTGIKVKDFEINKIDNFSYELKSNYLDYDLGVLSNNFKKVKVILKCLTLEDYLTFTGFFTFENKIGIWSNGIAICNLEGTDIYKARYKLEENGVLKLEKKTYNDKSLKIIITHNDDRVDTYKIFTVQDLFLYDINEFLKFEEDNIKSITLLEYNGEDFVEFKIPKKIQKILNKYI